MPDLETHPCRQLCNWRPLANQSDSRTMFQCLGCRSQWTADQAWTPAQANGKVPPAVIAERRRNDPHWGQE